MSIATPTRSPEHDELQALIEEARRRARRRRRRIAFVLTIVVLFVAGAYVLATRVYGRTTPSGAAASGPAPFAVGVGPFWYTRTLGTMRVPRCVKPLPGTMNRCASTVWFDVGMSNESWVGVDGTMRERSAEDWQRFASAADKSRWLATGRRVPRPLSVAQGDALVIGGRHFPAQPFGDAGSAAPPVEGPPGAVGGPLDVGDGVFTYRQLLTLPTAPAAVRRRIDQAETAINRRNVEILRRWHSPAARAVVHDLLTPPTEANRSIEELLLISHVIASPIPASVRVALFNAAASLPGVLVDRQARDPLGRPGTAITASAPYWDSLNIIFDPSTGEQLAGPGIDGGPPDVPEKYSTVVAEGPVASITALPRGIAAIPGVGAPSEPRSVAISPVAGRPSTVFTLRLAAVPGERARPAPTVWLGITGSAGRGTYRGGPEVVDRCLPGASRQAQPATVRRQGGQLIYTYRVRPPTARGRWCVGRYELGVQVFPNPIPRHYTTVPYTGETGTSIYFRVR